MISRRKAIKSLLAASPVTAFVNGFIIEPARLSITRREIVVPKLPAELDGLRIAHLTDFHYKPDTDFPLTEKVIAQVRAENVDLISLTGDFVDDDKQVIIPLLDQLKGLESKHGVFACLGNHDGWSGSREFYQKEFHKRGFDLLINQNTQLDIDGTPLHIAATDYVWLGSPDPAATLKGIPEQSPVLTLVHEPDYFDTMHQVRDIELQLSGHTHGGQCRVPLIGYAPKRVSYGRNYLYDLYQKENSQIFVSRGVGTTGIRVRFACPPELAILTLKSSTS